MTARDNLAASLTRRTATWEVAQSILELDLPLPREAEADLRRLAAQPTWTWQMHDDFDRVDPADTQIETFTPLFGFNVSDVNAEDPTALHALLELALRTLGVPDGMSAEDALAAQKGGRIDLSVTGDLGRKALVKRLRFLRRFEQKICRVQDTLRLRHAQMQAKSRLAYLIDIDRCDDATLAFCAYLAARANRRSVFMLGPQSRAQDTIVAALEQMLVMSPKTDWEQVAKVKPTEHVIRRADADARGRLIGMFHAHMADAANALGGLYGHLPERMRAEMVMVRGVDSSRWNAYAGALNTMRSAWIAAVKACDLDEILDVYCPGKAPRLMASDLVWWYRESGQDLHEDTRLFGALPHPWDVISGVAQLSRADVLFVADSLGVDARSSGWVSGRAAQELERPEPEPALVHGVIVSDPDLAVTLRRCGVFSAKQLRHADTLPETLSVTVVTDGDREMPVISTDALLTDSDS